MRLLFSEGIASLGREKCSKERFVIPELELVTVIESEYVCPLSVK